MSLKIVTRQALVGMIRAAALTAAFFLAGGALPFVGIVLTLMVPAPILAYAAARPDAKWRMASALVLALALVALVAGPMAAVGYAATFGVATLAMCLMLDRERSFESIVLVTTVAVLVAGGALLLAVAGSPMALANMVHDGLAAGMARSEQFYKTLGMGSGIDAESREQMLDLVVRLSPAIAVMSTAFTVMINLLFFWRRFGKQRLSSPLFGDLALWHAPEWIIWILLASGFGLFLPIAPLRAVALDTFICTAAIYFCHGAAIAIYYFRMLSVPVAIRGIILCVVMLQPVLAALVSVTGVFDMWVDFRRLKHPGKEAGSFGDFL